MKAVGWSGGINQRILVLSTKWRQVVSFTLRHVTPSTDRTGGCVIRTARFGVEKMSASCGDRTPIPSHSVVPFRSIPCNHTLYSAATYSISSVSFNALTIIFASNVFCCTGCVPRFFQQIKWWHHTRFECMCMTAQIKTKKIQSALFWDITQHGEVIFYRRFGTTYRSHIQRSSWTSRPLKMGPIRWFEASVKDYH
jgi:hypothetical protein